MTTSRLTKPDRRFLERPRIGFLTVAPATDEWPAPVPVWFELIGDTVQLFADRKTRKARRLATTPRASLVAANDVGEPENWVAITGPATIESQGAQDLANRLGQRYWDLTNPDLAAVVDGWLTDKNLVRIVIEADHVTRYTG
jgi:hypothetical protein